MAKKKSAKKPAKKKAPAKRKAANKKKPSSGFKLTSSSPAFTVNDLEKSWAWYRDVLGFTLDEKWERDGKLMGVSLQAGDVTFLIGQDDWAKGRDRVKGVGFRIYCETKSDIDALARAIESRGGRLDTQPTSQPWGNRDFSISDPDGFKITISSPAK